MSYQLCGYELESPLLNAAGSINGVNVEQILRETQLLLRTPIGAETLGSFTIPQQEGNEAKYGAPVYYHDPETRLTYNSMGLPNIGLAKVVKLAPQLLLNAEEYGKPLIFSGSPTNDPENKYGNSADQAARLAYELLSTCVDMVEINVSCPNVVTEGGGRKPIMGYDLESLEEMQAAIKHMVGTGQALGIKMPPYITPEEKSLIPDIAELIRSENVFKYLVTANTIPNQIPVDVNRSAILSVPGGKGGMSGPSTKPQGREQLALWHTALGDSIDIVSTLGVDSGQELAMRRRLGAVAAGGVTFLWESNNWGIAVEQVLQDYAKAGAP